MADPIPIKADVVPSIDVERELLDWFGQKLKAYREENGYVPLHAAVALIGDMENVDKGASIASSWSPSNEQASQFAVNSTAAMMFQKRALK